MEAFKECQQPQEILDALKDMLKTLKGFIVLAGKNGTGKTFASKCVYNAMIYPLIWPEYNHDLAFFSSQAELSLRLDEIRVKFGETGSYLKEIRDSKLLILDDVGTRIPSEAYLNFIYALIDYRSNLQMATIITTNKTASELRPILSDAIVSRIASGKCFRLEGDDRRFKDF